MKTLSLAVVALLAAMAPLAAQQSKIDPAAAANSAPQRAVEFLPFERAKFDAAAKALGATDAQLQAFTAQSAELGAARAADALVRSLAPTFDAAVKLAEASDPTAALELTKVLAGTESALLQGHVRYHLARLFLDSDDPDLAATTLAEYFDKSINLSPLDGEAAFFYAQALADVPVPEAATRWFEGFLAKFPDASERFRSAASQRLGEIKMQQESRLHELANGMQKTTRDLRRAKTDKPVQLDQEKYLQELDTLIEEYQKREQQSSGSPSGLGPSSAPASNSALVDGEGTVGNLNKRPSLVDRWGDMKDADREKIQSEVNSKLPPQYRKAIGGYYNKLTKEAEKK
jgi:hypothetical protein